MFSSPSTHSAQSRAARGSNNYAGLIVRITRVKVGRIESCRGLKILPLSFGGCVSVARCPRRTHALDSPHCVRITPHPSRPSGATMEPVEPVVAYIALGSNLGDREEHLQAAVTALSGLDDVDVVAVVEDNFLRKVRL